MKDNGGRAFPRPYSVDDYGDYPQNENGQEGMTLRDYFAGQALVAIIGKIDESFTDAHLRDISKTAYGYADNMIKERDK